MRRRYDEDDTWEAGPEPRRVPTGCCCQTVRACPVHFVADPSDDPASTSVDLDPLPDSEWSDA